MLKNSGLMSSVSDKDFLLAVTQGYAVLADLEENISMYYQLKLTAQNDMSKDFSEKQRERFYTGDMYERWECIFSVPCFAEFMLTAPYYFPRDISKDCWRTSIGRYGRSKRNTNWIKKRPMIKVTDIHKRFGDLEVLKGVSLDVARGEVVSDRRCQRRRQDHAVADRGYASAPGRRTGAKSTAGCFSAGR